MFDEKENDIQFGNDAHRSVYVCVLCERSS